MGQKAVGYNQISAALSAAVGIGNGMSVVKAPVVIAAGGTGYKPNDFLTATGGTADYQAIFRVLTVDVNGAVLTAEIANSGLLAGYYSKAAKPANPVTTTTSGAGASCTLTLSYTDDVPPVGADSAVITIEGAGVRWRDDGVAPTAAVGGPLLPGQTLNYAAGPRNQLKLIQQSAGAIANVSFYRTGGGGV
jgi:hypothetical protein